MIKNFITRLLQVCTAVSLLLLGINPSLASSIVLQSTTSTENSGLYDYILPIFTQQHGIDVKVVAVGTGQALKNARNGDGDVILVHAKTEEQSFVEQGYGVERFDVMYNDFILVGPKDAGLSASPSESIVSVLQEIASRKLVFVSRGDDSGTHKKEVSLWQAAEVNIDSGNGQWYRESGSGMGATLNTAIGMGAFTLTDRSTWISFNNKQDYQIHVQGDSKLFNQYGVILVNPNRHPHIKSKEGQTFIDWLTGENGQNAIGAYVLNGQQLFFPNANKQTQ